MSAQRFMVGSQFYWQETLYEVKHLLPESRVNLHNLHSGEMVTVLFTDLLKALFADHLHFVQNGKVQPEASPYLDLADCPPHLLEIAQYRLKVIRPLINLPLAGRKRAVQKRVQALKQCRAETGSTLKISISVASVYRWLKSYRDSGEDLRALIPNSEKQGGKKQTRLAVEVEAIIQAVINDHYYRRENRTIDYLLHEIALRIEEENSQRRPSEKLTVPSRATVDRRLAKLDVEGKLIAKRGRRAAKRELTQYGQANYPTMPLERVEIDHTKADLIVVDERDMLPLGRPTLTYCLDVATRYPLGYYLGFEPPSYLSVMQCLFHAIQPKDDVCSRYNTENQWQACGIPYTLVIDNGREFIGRDLQDACQLLGITLERTPVRTPEFKAAVERMYGTLNTGLLHGLPGTTFSNIVQRGDYDSYKQASISLESLDKMMHIFLLDIYAERYHRGLQGIPGRKWEEMVKDGFFPRVPNSAKELEILLGRVDYRTVQSYGIEFQSLRYNCPELTLLRTRLKKSGDKRIKLKYQPSDLGSVHVYDPFEQEYIEVPALVQEYASGLSLWKHRVIRNYVLSQQEKVDLAALGRAQRKIQEIVEDSLQKKKLRTRTRIARWQGQDTQPPLIEGANTNENGVEQNSDAIGELINQTELQFNQDELEEKGWGIFNT